MKSTRPYRLALGGAVAGIIGAVLSGFVSHRPRIDAANRVLVNIGQVPVEATTLKVVAFPARLIPGADIRLTSTCACVRARIATSSRDGPEAFTGALPIVLSVSPRRDGPIRERVLLVSKKTGMGTCLQVNGVATRALTPSVGGNPQDTYCVDTGHGERAFQFEIASRGQELAPRVTLGREHCRSISLSPASADRSRWILEGELKKCLVPGDFISIVVTDPVEGNLGVIVAGK